MLSSARGLGLPRGLVVRRFVVLFIAVLLSFSLRGQPRPHRITTSRTA